MLKEAYVSAKQENRIFDDEEARSAIEFALDLLNAEKTHLEATEPGSYASISKLDAAWSELSSLASDLEDFMD